MPPVIVESGGQRGGSSIAVTPTTGNYVLLWIALRDLTAGSIGGWTNVSSTVLATGDSGRWYKRGPTAGESSYTIGGGAINGLAAWYVVSGTDLSDMTIYETSGASGTTLALGSVTDPDAQQLILLGAVYDTAFNGVRLVTPGAGWITDYNNGMDAGASDKHPHTWAAHWDGVEDPLTASGTITASSGYGGVVLQINPDTIPPVADFSGTPLVGEEPLSVAFTDESTNDPTSWAWDFGDGGTSTAQNPTHEYTAPGVYTVELTATNGAGSDTETKIAYVTVQDLLPPFVDECRPMLLDIYEPGVGINADELTYLETLCSAFDQWIVDEELGVGSGGLTINRYSAEATAAILGDGQNDVRLAKVRIPAIREAPLFGVWLRTGNFGLLSESEQGGEDLQFGGPGALAYLDFARMAPRAWLQFDPGPPAFALPDPVDGVWHFVRPDSSSALAFLESAHNGTGSLVTSWELPSINPSGDDVLLLAFLQVRPDEDVTFPAGWTNRVQQDTSGLGTELRYILADRYHATGAGPYDDTVTFPSARITAAQLGFRTSGAPTPVTASAFDTISPSASSHEISATLSGAPDPGSVLVMYVSQTTTGGGGSIGYDFEPGWTQLERIPNQNTYTGYAAVAYKVADGTETDVSAVIGATGTHLNSASMLVANYPIVYSPLKAGEILYMVLAELFAVERPVNPLPLLTLDFTFEEDSDGNPWDETPSTAQFTARVNESVLDVVKRLILTGALVLDMDVSGPGLVLHAYNRSTYGRDLTGAAFGAGVVRFVAGENIATRLGRERQPARVATHAWVTGDDDVYALVQLPDAASRVTREVGIQADSGTTDGTALAGIGDAELAGRLERAERLSAGVVLGDDELTGRYLPGPAGSSGHYWKGDTITLQTGDGEFDYDDEPFRIAAIAIAEQRGKRAAVVEATDLEVSVRLGSNMDPRTDTDGSSGTGSSDSSSSSGGGVVTNLTSYQLRSEKGQPDGYASIDTDGHVPASELGSGAIGDGTLGLRDDETWGLVPVVLDDLTDVSAPAPVDGEVLTWDAYTGAWVAGTAVPIVLDDLADVVAPAPADGEVLTWDDYANVWVPAAPAGGALALDDLTDVNAPTPADGEMLAWDATPGEWVPVPPPSGSVPSGSTVGDILVWNGSAWAILAIGGTDDHVLTVDSGETLGLKYAAAAAGVSPVISAAALTTAYTVFR